MQTIYEIYLVNNNVSIWPIHCNKYTIGMVNTKGIIIMVNNKRIWEIFVFSTQIFHKSKTALKNSLSI